MTLMKRLRKYVKAGVGRRFMTAFNVEYDYVKALGYKRVEEIKNKLYVRTYENNPRTDSRAK